MIFKFRAWDGISKKMWNPVWFDFVHIYYGFDDEKDCPIAVMPRWDTNPIMQFTGLLDKNGKEIFEGDIIVPNIAPYCQGLKDGDACIVEWCDCGGWYPFADNYDGEPYPYPSESEVIGNIYEHPELLKGEK